MFYDFVEDKLMVALISKVQIYEIDEIINSAGMEEDKFSSPLVEKIQLIFRLKFGFG